MRKSVFAGLLVSALVFIANPTSASAQSSESLLFNESDTNPALELVEVVDNIQNDVQEEEEVPAPAPQPQVHTVGANDTLESIAEEYSTTWKRLYDKNTDIEHPDVISEGDTITIPLDGEVVEEREPPVVVQPAVVPQPVATAVVATRAAPAPRPTAQAGGTRAVAHSGWFPANQCTGYVASRRPVGQWNNASQWFWQAQRDGWATGYTARVGAAAVTKSGNHVAYVERVDGDRIYISERNYDWNGSYRERWVPASNYKYIY